MAEVEHRPMVSQKVATRIKECMCYVASEMVDATKPWDTRTKKRMKRINKTMDYKLPDGQVVTLGDERFRSPEVLFQPEAYGVEAASIIDILLQSVMKVQTGPTFPSESQKPHNQEW